MNSVTKTKNVRVTRGNYPDILHCAAAIGCLDSVKALLDAGCGVNLRDSYGYTALIVAVKSGFSDIVTMLLERGEADTNCVDKSGWTALFYAVQYTAKQVKLQSLPQVKTGLAIVKALLDGGAMMSFRDLDKSTALHHASEGGCNDIVKVFVNRGCAVNVVDKQMKTPLHYAARGYHRDVARCLLAAGANPRLMDDYNDTPVDYCYKPAWKKEFKLLVKDSRKRSREEMPRPTKRSKTSIDSLVKVSTLSGTRYV